MKRRWWCLVLLALAGCHEIDPDFTQAFVDANRSLDDDAWAAAYSPEMRLLVVGRESGRLELWDASSKNKRIAREAHALRLQGIAFGPEDGIVITNSASGNVQFDDLVELENGPKVWDAKTGELLQAFRDGDWGPGAVSATPLPGLYLLGSHDKLHLYDHAKRGLVGAPLELKENGNIRSIDWDAASGLIAAGTREGWVLVLRLKAETGTEPQLQIVSRHAPHGGGARRDILAVKWMDEGQKLVTVQYSPERAQAMQQDVPPMYRRSQHETVRWDIATWRREHTYSSSLISVQHATSTRGDDWLVLSGIAGGTARVEGKIELVDLRTGVAWLYKANTTHPTAVLLPQAREGLILQNGRASRIKYLDQSDEVPWSPPR